MPWVILVIAGLLEVGWAVGLKYTHGFTRPVPSLLTIVMLIASVILLSIAARELPIGTAYAVWVGIGALGAAALGIFLFQEPVTVPRLFFLSLLLVAIVGLKMTSSPE
jgi:quaternary ammonium compound-resistance protein SugE